MADWQPIESAPKDGTKILVGRFVEKCPHGANGRMAVDYWHNSGQKYGFTGFARFNNSYWPATHWMPLPPPPQEAGHE